MAKSFEELASVLRSRWGLRLCALTLAYTGGLVFCLLTAWQIRFDFVVPEVFQGQSWSSLLWIIPLKLLFLAMLRQFSGMMSFFGVRDLFRLLTALLGSSVTIALIRITLDPSMSFAPPRGVILIDFVLAFLGLSFIRLFLRIYRERESFSSRGGDWNVRRVAIVGAGPVGGSLARDLFARRGLGMRPVCFFDDDQSKWNSRIYDVPVIGAPELLREDKYRSLVEEVIVALPTGSAKRTREVIEITQEIGVRCEKVPAIEELATGRVKVSELREIEIQDLLGREPVALEMDHIRHLIQEQVVLVTGAGGSIGSELCRQISALNPERLLLVEQCEVQLFAIEQELKGKGFGSSLMPLIADVLDRERMHQLFTRFKPNVVFHAAAHKHVPMMEHQPAEAFKNNSLATSLIAELAENAGVGLFLLISTDKAINPTSVMGTSKRLAEVFIQSLHSENPAGTKFVAVRFGNVLGSSGSVVPIFEKQIAVGGPVRVTHPDVTRYFMTIPEAVGLVLQSASQAVGGEIFVLDMGSPVKIVDLARQLIAMHGHKAGEDIDIEYVGLRPGEKLFEEISHEGENLEETNHPKIMRFVCEPQPLQEVRATFASINSKIYTMEPDQLKLLFQSAVPEYKPFLS